MDKPPPDDFDEHGAAVNYYGPVSNGNGIAIIKWVASTAGLCLIAVIGFLFIDNASIRREANDDRKALTEQLVSIRERLTAIETKQQTGCRP